MTDSLFCDCADNSIKIQAISTAEFTKTVMTLSKKVQNWFSTNEFTAKSGTFCLVPSDEGGLQQVYVGMDGFDDAWAFGALPKALPAGQYHVDTQLFSQQQLESICYSWGLGGYTFDRYKAAQHSVAQLCVPEEVDRQTLDNRVACVYLARDLINTPAEDLRPISYTAIIKDIAKQHGAKCKVFEGKTLLKEFPLVHAVGRASEQPPCLVELNWGDDKHPTITLVGKGVCFDSGGLDVKSAAGMRFMKKDMGGSANVLALAQLIMMQQLPVRLRVILPIVENAVAGNAMRPGDVFTSRLGKTVEIGNTDAEGRLILADALTYASETKPDYLIDMATLTGAAKAALGPDIPGYFANEETLAADIMKKATQSAEMICRLPLYQPYRCFLDSKIADLNNMSSHSSGGTIAAALFLQEFVGDDIPWVHFDFMAWNTRTLPGRPEGGEAMALNTLYRWVESVVAT
ncbi:MAG: leucyl aminopeptidase [Coxiella sp. (in: Bacteria)]|nr:MAG: leucyl aminopeptidase [Coxiella sp. (in: g-proteobacteria)]